MDKKIYLLLAPFVGLLLLFLSYQSVLANWFLDSSSKLFYQAEGSILGKEDKVTPPGQSNKSPQAEKNVSERSQGTLPAIQVSPQGTTVRVESRANKLQLRFMDKNGQEVEGPEGTESAELEIEEPQDQDTIRIRSQENAALVIRNKIAAQTHFPIMVNLETNELIITTPKGQKVVTVLPDQAVAHMLAANVLDQLGGKGGLRWVEYQQSQATPSASPTATPSASPTSTPSATPEATPSVAPSASPSSTETTSEAAILTADNEGNLVYEIAGFKTKKFLGFYKISLKRTAVVSAETGALLSLREDLPTRIIDFLSF